MAKFFAKYADYTFIVFVDNTSIIHAIPEVQKTRKTHLIYSLSTNYDFSYLRGMTKATFVE